MAQGHVKAKTPSYTRLITFLVYFQASRLYVFTNTSNLKPLHLSCLAGVCVAWLPVFHSCPLVPTPCLRHLRPELTAGGAPVGRWELAFLQSGPWWAGPTFSPGMALGTELSDIEDGTLSVRLPSVFNAIVVFEGTLPYGYWFAWWLLVLRILSYWLFEYPHGVT